MTDIIVPSSPADQKKLKDAVVELSNSLYREEAEKENRKSILDTISDELGIKKKYINRMAKEYHKNEFDAKSSENTSYEELYETVLG